MFSRFTLAVVTAAITLSGCARHHDSDADTAFSGSARLDVTHVVARGDDGSSVFLTVDGKDAGPLSAGEGTEVSVPPGKHKIGGYVQTLLGLGRVTITPLDITTQANEIQHIAYSVTANKPGFAVTKTELLPPPKPASVSQPLPAARPADTTPDTPATAAASSAGATAASATDSSSATAASGNATSSTPAASASDTGSDAAAESVTPASSSPTTSASGVTNNNASSSAAASSTATGSSAQPATPESSTGSSQPATTTP